jgi:hypothetical protein
MMQIKKQEIYFGWTAFLSLPLLLVERGQVVEDDGHAGMLWPQGALCDGQGALRQGNRDLSAFRADQNPPRAKGNEGEENTLSLI